MRTATQTVHALVGLTAAMTRAVAVLGALAVLSTVYLVGLAGRSDTHDVPRPTARNGQPVWKGSYSHRFPGCVAVVLWPPDEVPRALVVRDRHRGLVEISAREAAVRVRDATERLDTVGACR